MQSLNYLITAKHYAEREGAPTVKDRILRLHAKRNRRARAPLPLQINTIVPHPVMARIELGQVVADCECGGCEFVDPSEPIFYCCECFNRLYNGALRPVQFPEPAMWEEITRLILLRPVDDIRGKDDCDRAAASRAIIYLEQADGRHLPLTRSWNPNESVGDLILENEAVEKWATAQLKAGE